MAVELPYPSMVFVPLDILTADEMNQMVANDQYLAGLFPLASDNVDWATVDGSELSSDAINAMLLNAPVASTTSSGPYGITINLQRLGNLVFYKIYSAPSSSMVASSTSAETIPTGYRPASASNTTARSNSMIGEWRVNTAGTCYWWFSEAPGTSMVLVDTVYFTNDAWPSS